MPQNDFLRITSQLRNDAEFGVFAEDLSSIDLWATDFNTDFAMHKAIKEFDATT